MSVELGLIHSSDTISYYEFKMNEDKSKEWIKKGLPEKYLR